MGRYISDFLIGFPAICKLCCVVSCPYYCCYLLLSAPAQECVQSNYVANSHPALFQQHHSIRENISRLAWAQLGLVAANYGEISVEINDVTNYWHYHRAAPGRRSPHSHN